MAGIPRINADKVTGYLINFLRDEFKKNNFRTAVLGLSGGLDSTAAAYLCKMALGGAHTYGIILPYRETSKESLDHAYLVCRLLDIRHLTFNITAPVDDYFKNFPQADPVRKGNKMARERMSILYDLSSHFQGLVVGTSNKSERYLGYGTIYGDLAYALNPIGDLYKTQIYQLAEYLKIPEEIRNKVPSADLWPGQTDEGELGVSYAEADLVLYYYVDKHLDPDVIVKTKGLAQDVVMRVVDLVRKSEFKRRPPLVASIPDEIKY